MLLKYMAFLFPLLLSCQSVSKNDTNAPATRYYSGNEYVYKPYSNDKQEKIKSLMSLLREETSYLDVKLVLVNPTVAESEPLFKNFRFKRDNDVNTLLNTWANALQWGCWVVKGTVATVDASYYYIDLYFYDKNGVLLNKDTLFNDGLGESGRVYLSTQKQYITIREEISNWKKLPNIDQLWSNMVSGSQ